MAAKLAHLQQGMAAIVECMRKQKRVGQLAAFAKCGISLLDLVPAFGSCMASPLRAIAGAVDACASLDAVKRLTSELGVDTKIQAAVQKLADEEQAAGVYKKGVDFGSRQLQDRLFDDA